MRIHALVPGSQSRFGWFFPEKIINIKKISTVARVNSFHRCYSLPINFMF
jgi:hypothetical protein